MPRRMARINRMNTDQPSWVQEHKDAEDRRASNSYLVFLGWIGVELVGYAAVVLSASGVTPANCTGLCFSPRDFLVLLGMMFGLWLLLGQVIVGMLITTAYNRRQMTSLSTGSLSFFATFAIVAVIIGLFLGATR
jgi:hypothetical protein